MAVPHIQPYQADPNRRPSSFGSGRQRDQREGWQKASATGGAIWFGGWLLGYGFLWPLFLLLQILGAFLPIGSLLSWWDRGAPAPDLYPAASELRLPQSQVSQHLDNYVRSYGDAALIFAAHDGYAQLVRSMLLSRDLGYGDLIDAADESGHTAMLYAAGQGFPEVATALLRGGADPDAPRQGKGGLSLTPLMEGAGAGHREVVAALLQANATIDLRDDHGNTALMYAAHAGQLGPMQELLQRGAMRDLANKWGDTALTLAGVSRHQAVMDALQRGARPVVDGQGRRQARANHLAAAAGAGTESGTGAAGHRSRSASEDEAPGLLSSVLSKGADVAKDSLKDLAGIGFGAAARDGSSSAGADARVRELEAQLASLRSSKEEDELKAQRRIVELLEQSTDKQKRIDDADKELRDLRPRVEDLSAKVRQREASNLEEQERSSKATKEAHEARMEAERERTRAESAERDKVRQVEEAQRHEDEAKRRRVEASDNSEQVERLQQQLKTLRAEVDRAEEERRRAQRQLADYRAGLLPETLEQATGTAASTSAEASPATELSAVVAAGAPSNSTSDEREVSTGREAAGESEEI